MNDSNIIIGEEEKKVKIVWLSDIHLRGSYQGKAAVREKMDPFINGFIKKIATEQDIDYILISGDLAFSGSKDDYDFFWECFVKQMHASLPQPFPKVITIPGNHDISWSNLRQFSDYLRSYNKTTQSFNDRNKKLTSETKQFYKSFKNYSATFGTNSSNKQLDEWKALFDLDDANLEVLPDYKTNRLFGYLIDHKKQIIFVLFNTAWYSIGEKFNELLVKDLYKQKGSSLKEPIMLKQSELLELLKKKDNIVEYGNQVIGRDLFPIIEVMKKATIQCSDYMVITTMHHPLNWLNWHEMYDFTDTINNNLTLNKVISISDVLLSGHEHVPISNRTETINDKNLLHLKAGMFMEDQLDVLQGDAYFEHSRFSILELNIQRKSFKERRIIFNNTEWEERKDLEKINLLKKKSKFLEEETKKQLISSIPKFSAIEYLTNRGILKQDKKVVQEKLVAIDKNYEVIKLTHNKQVRFCILPLTYDFYSQTLDDFSHTHFIDKLLKKNKEVYPVTIHFIWLDLIVKETLTEKYLSGSNDFNDVLYEIIKYCDLNFNKFRHRFFERLEIPKVKRDKIIDFKLVKDIRLINEVVRFWSFKDYTNSV